MTMMRYASAPRLALPLSDMESLGLSSRCSGVSKMNLIKVVGVT